MYIGEVAKLTGASVKAIRHYEALGLLGQVEAEIRSCLAGAELPAQDFAPFELAPDSRLASSA